jgi:hypothetical protein
MQRGAKWSGSAYILTSRRSRVAQRLAESCHRTLEALIAALIERLDATEATGDPLLGMFAREPELIDQIAESAMQAREKHPLRANHR